MKLDRTTVQQKIRELQNRAAVEAWLVENYESEGLAEAVCDDLDSYDWSEA